VPAGPGVILIGLEANYSLDNRANRLGLLYNRKAAIEGSDCDKIAQALRAALNACRRLEGEPEFQGKLIFDTGEIEILINDRMLAPNTDEMFARLRPAVERAIALVSRTGSPAPHAVLERTGEARERLRIAVHAG
jgi:hypothetical protein